MKLDEIRAIAQQHGIKTSKTKKAELIRAIQNAEQNDQCFEAGKAGDCGQEACLWRGDCS
ncbi:Rho termination factor N-terminal domain-containing protein [Geobacter pelophilus]|uniref:Rho termination factor N-terminal domain-containing protein n=1 Tax=Geoanaerobacter pelophilus TaxID=60036 RepID=A0AAW4L4Q9_9BACT|nr:Rho termination factor N-terminal domain-containing protein [Geoanaerobacter pelophilus]MBT0666199.1 Rho termination factor N-terminal domain-containing protein [Geoanaerobacter pelophilus]